MADFVAGPQSYTFPLWRGQDSSFIVKRKNPATGAYLDYDAGTTAKIVFTSGSTNYEFSAVITGHQAQFTVDDEAVKDVRNGSLWRLQFTINGKDKSPVVGKVVRKDAK